MDEFASHIITACSIYLPADRRMALARGVQLVERTHGAALFADISGFTPLTEALTQTLGLRRGAEELPQHLNRVYAALVAEVDRYGGSVISFAGDAITCWFDDDSAPSGFPKPEGACASWRATACALAMQQVMWRIAVVEMPGQSPVALSVKVAIASGPARRFVVGDPAIQLLDALAGETLARMAETEHLTKPGEVVIDAPTAAALGERALVREIERGDRDRDGRRFFIVSGLADEVEVTAWPPIERSALSEEAVRPWVLPAVYERLRQGLGEFLTELRPAVTLFLRFGGIDYDADEAAGAKLNAYLRWVQGVVTRHEGALLQLMIGDKGSHVYIVFGAPVAHEDDARRAVTAALELGRPPADLGYIGPVQIGISRGTLRAGAYGGITRRTYGVLGDDVNLAARLMSQAAPGEVLISSRVQKAVAAEPGLSRDEGFCFEPRPPIRLKGKAEPLPVFAVTGMQQRRAIRLQEPTYALPMVGRVQELALVQSKLALALQGHGQIVGITAEAGLGKSRLVAEVIRLARRCNVTGYGGACQSDGVNTSYLVWRPIWSAFFDLDPAAPLRKQIRTLESQVQDLAPERAPALPLLSAVLGLPIPDNDFTRTLEPQYRRSALEALLLECLKVSAREAAQEGGGLLFVLEDLHWLDPASHDLLEQVAHTIVDLPVLIVLAYRPPELLRLQAPRVEGMPHYTKITLTELSAAESELAIRAKLAQLFPERGGAVPAALIEQVTARAQGNPFYIEELLNYLHDRNIDLRGLADLEGLLAELPASLHSLILSRIDQLTTHQQLALKVASVIGRLFRFAHLHGYYPALGEPEPLRADLTELARLDLTPLDTPEPELAYLFKHIVTREVAYENLPYATRAMLHEQYARFLEVQSSGEAIGQSPLLDVLAYHYSLSENLPKKREYLRKAGEAAAARFANVEAVEYLTRALELVPEADTERAERYALLLAREQVLDVQGQREVQARDLAALEGLVVALDDPYRQAEVALRRSHYADLTDDLLTAIAAAQVAVEQARLAHSPALEAEGLFAWGDALNDHSDTVAAREKLDQSLALARAAGVRRVEARGLAGLAAVTLVSDDIAGMRSYSEQALALSREIGDRRWEAMTLDYLGDATRRMSDTARAKSYWEQALSIYRELGDLWGESMITDSLGFICMDLGDLAGATAYFEHALRLSRQVHYRGGEAEQMRCLGYLLAYQGDYLGGKPLLEQALAILQEVDSRSNEALVHRWLADLLCALGQYDQASSHCHQAIQIDRELDYRSEEGKGACQMGFICQQSGDLSASREYAREGLRLLSEAQLPRFLIEGLWCQGYVHTQQGAYTEAVAAYQQAIELAQTHGKQDVRIQNVQAAARAGLALILSAQGDVPQAVVQVEQVLSQMQAFPTLYGAQEPLRVYLDCYRVLRAAGDPHARTVLEKGHALLQEWAAKITDEPLRRSFLENVAANRELAAQWEQASSHK